MADGLRAASVWAAFGIDTSAATKSLEKLTKDVQKNLKQVAEAGSKLGGFGLAAAAGMGAFVKAAAGHNAQAAASVKNLENGFARLSTAIGVIFIPLVDKVAGVVRQVANAVDQLSPGMQSLIATVAAFGTTGLIAIGVIGKLAGGLSAIITLAATVAPAVAGLFGPILVGIASVAVAVPVIYTAWTENWGNVQTYFREVIAKLQEWWNVGVEGILGSLVWFANKAKNVLLTIAGVMADNDIARQALKRLMDMQITVGDLKGVTAQLSDSVEAGLKSGLKKGVKAWKEIGSKAAEMVGGVLGEMFGGPGGSYQHDKIKKDEVAKEERVARAEVRAERASERKDPARVLRDGLVNITGEVGRIVSSVMSGFGTGGVWGAVLAAIFEVLSRLEAFMEQTDAVMGTVSSVLALLNAVLRPIFEIGTIITRAITDLVIDILRVFDPAKAQELREKEDKARARLDRSINENTLATERNTATMASLNAPSGVSINGLGGGIGRGVVIINGGVKVTSTGASNAGSDFEETEFGRMLRRGGSKYDEPQGGW